MIVPMKKLWLVVLEKDKPEALSSLRKFGLMHVEASLPSGAEYDRLVRERDDMTRALNIVPQAKKPNPVRLDPAAALGLARSVIDAEQRIRQLLDEAGSLDRDLDKYKPWGDFDVADIAALREKGVCVRLYDTETKKLAEAPEGVDVVVLSRGKRNSLCVVVTRGESAVTPMPQNWIEFAPPKESPDALRVGLERKAADIAALRAGIAEAALDSPSIRKAIESTEQEITFSVVRGSFESEGPVCYVSGYVPAREAKAIEALASDRGWGLLSDEPAIEDATPTKVENGPIVRMIEPVIQFLGIVPGYREYEISAWFLMFFSVFFAMIFGDGGYGLLLLAVGVAAAIKAKASGKVVPDAIRLLLLLSSMTILWGVVTATWFGIPSAALPVFIQNIAFWPLSNLNPQSSQNIQVFCFLIGTAHLSIAHIKNIIRDFPSLKFLGQLGSLAMLYGMLFFVLTLVVSSKRFPAPPYAVWLVVGGFASTIIFGAYDGNILKSFLEGLKGIIPNFLGAVGVFADIVSYIRLWAVGLAGSSLSGIINSMAGGMFKPFFMIIFGVMLLFVGHSINLVLNVLSVIVHGVRLNILEFSNHLGMEWSGIKYDPFRVTYKSDR